MTSQSRLLACAALAAIAFAAPSAAAEPTDPVVIGWWSYFDDTKVPTTSSAAHQVTSFGDPDTYYYEPSGGKGLQEDPTVLPTDQAWQNMISYILAKSGNVTLSPDFSIDTSSDLSQWTEAYYGYAFVLLYVPKDKYCDQYRIHIGSVDDGVQAMANGNILGYANLGDSNVYIDMVKYQSNPAEIVLRPGINEVVLIHEDQAAVQRYVHNVWIEHDGTQIPLAPKSIVWGRTVDSTTQSPLYQAKVGINGGTFSDTFLTGPLGFYFFAGLADGPYTLTADRAQYITANAAADVALGAANTEVVRTDLALDPGCQCPSGTVCGASGGCLDPCITKNEFGETCTDPAATCVNHACVKDACDTLTCSPGFSCQAGTCVEDACSNVCCGAGQVCAAGLCVTDNCGAGCASDQVCAGGECVDACSVIQCVQGLACKAGVCLEKCKADPASCQTSDGGFLDGGFGGFGGAAGGSADASADGAGGHPSGATSDASGGGSSGCGCRTAGGSSGAPIGGAILGLALGLARRRRSRVGRS